MTKLRVLVMLTSIILVVTFATLIGLYAKGYRLNPDDLSVQANGLLVIKSHPDGAQVYLNGDLETATNANVNLPPNTYDLRVEKQGFRPWTKRITIEKEIVTEITAHLFRSAPSLSAVTFSTSTNPVPSYDFSKIAYVVPPGEDTNDENENSGLWIVEMINLPLGFSRDPRRVTDGNLQDAEIIWSPDAREIILTTDNGTFLLNAGEFTPQAQRVNIGKVSKQEMLEDWEESKIDKQESRINNLPEEVQDVLTRKAREVVFSPDEEMVMYVASGSATLSDDLIEPVPGASTQSQEREIQENRTYVYDIEEDRNFLIDDSSDDLTIEGGMSTDHIRRISWFPTSRHAVLAEPNRIVIMDHDGTNRQEVYSGIYVAPHAYPTLSLDRIIILTNLGAEGNPTFLYSIGLK